jgi:hypothetical protein
MINACFGVLFLRERNSGTRPIHARNERLNEEKLRDNRVLDNNAKRKCFIWALDCPSTLLGMVRPSTHSGRMLSAVECIRGVVSLPNHRAPTGLAMTGVICRSIFYIFCRFRTDKGHFCLPLLGLFYAVEAALPVR